MRDRFEEPSDRSAVELVLSRRALLANGGRAALSLAAVGGMAGLIAACGGDDSEDGAGAAASSSGEKLTLEDVAAATGTVRAAVWHGYDDKAIFKGLEGARLRAGYLTRNEDVLTDLRVGDRAVYELTTIYQSYIDALLAVDVIAPIDPELLTNFSGMFARFRDEESLRRDGELYLVPYLWGTQHVNYRADVLDAPQTFDDLMDPSLKGKIGLNDDLYAAITQFARFAGVEDPTRVTPEALEETMALLRKFKPQVAAIQPGSELTGLLVRGEVVVSTPDWAPSAVQAREQGLEVEATMPAFTFIDGWLMVRGGQNPAATYKLMDHAISTEAQVAAATHVGLGIVNEAAAGKLPSDVRESARINVGGTSMVPYDDLDGLLTAAPAYRGLPVEPGEFTTLQDWVRAWETFKAS